MIEVNGHNMDNDNDDDEEDDVGMEWAHDRLASFKARVLKGHKKGVIRVLLINGETQILSASKDGDVRLWNVIDGRHLHHFPKRHSLDISDLKVDPWERTFVTAGWDKAVKSFDLLTGDLLWEAPHEGLVTSCDIDEVGKLVVSAFDGDGIVGVWDAISGVNVCKIADLHKKATITHVKWLKPGEKFATASFDGSVRVWDLRAGRSTAALTAHKSVVSCMDAVGDDLVVTGSWDRSILLWDISTGLYRSNGPRAFDQAHEGCIASVDIHESRNYILSAGYDKTLNVWDLVTSRKKFHLKGHDDWINDAKLSADLNWVVSASNDKTIRIWDMQKKDDGVASSNPASHGLEMAKCAECGRSFSIINDITICVFCRRNQKS